jgi:hypothetical protein
MSKGEAYPSPLRSVRITGEDSGEWEAVANQAHPLQLPGS